MRSIGGLAVVSYRSLTTLPLVGAVFGRVQVTIRAKQGCVVVMCGADGVTTTSQIPEMPRDLITHNRVARLAADLTPAAFACFVTFDSELDEISVVSVSGTSTKLFSQVNNSARRSESGWVPSITVSATANLVLDSIFHDKSTVSARVSDFIDGVIATPLINSTFARFNNNWCSGMPIVINSKVYAALIFAAHDPFTRAQIDSCRQFVSKCASSISSLLEERSISDQMEALTERRRVVQMDDPLGLTQRKDATSATPRSFGDIKLSLETQTASRGDRELNLTRREFDLLDTFLQSPGTALSRIQIISRVWVERNGISSNVLNVTVKNLREKLEAAGESRVIHSLRAYGYVLKA
jgi:hypothetical protein